MNDGLLTIDFARLRETSSHIQAAVTSMSSQLDQLERDAAPLVATWSGEAQQAYRQRQATWRQASNELVAMLQGIRRALDESIDDFYATEKRNVALFAGG